MTRDIPPVWRDWILTNLERGCRVSDMVASMVQAQLDAATANSWISAVSGKPVTSSTDSIAVDIRAPYIHEGSRIAAGNTIALSDRRVRIAFRQSRPDIVLVEDLLTPEECDELISLSLAKLEPSMIVDPTSGAERVIIERSSEGTYFQRGENALIKRLDRRIAELANWQEERGEGLQILHYRTGGEYKPHYDFFPPHEPGSASHMATGGQRQATLIMYLNNVEQGGETIFPDAGLSITPRRGAAVYFAYGNSLGQIDAATLHGGAPVLAGEKWIATKWMRERVYG